MRITNKSLVSNYLNTMRVNLNTMQRYQNQLGTGKEILRPSDNPYIAVRSMGMQSVIAKNEQYKRNIEDAEAWLNVSDDAVRGVVDTLRRFKELTEQAKTPLASSQSLKSIEEEMKQNIQLMGQTLNATYDGRHILGGFITDKSPFYVDPSTNLLEFQGSLLDDNANGKINREIAQGVDIPINTTPSKIMGGDGTIATDDMGKTLQKVVNTIKFMSGDTAIPAGDRYTGNPLATPPISELEEAMKELDVHFNRNLENAAEIGAKTNRVEAALKRNKTENLNLVDLLAKVEDIDFVDKITQFSSMQMIYDASLAVGSKIMQNSLVNYLK